MAAAAPQKSRPMTLAKPIKCTDDLPVDDYVERRVLGSLDNLERLTLVFRYDEKEQQVQRIDFHQEKGPPIDDPDSIMQAIYRSARDWTEDRNERCEFRVKLFAFGAATGVTAGFRMRPLSDQGPEETRHSVNTMSSNLPELLEAFTPLMSIVVDPVLKGMGKILEQQQEINKELREELRESNEHNRKIMKTVVNAHTGDLEVRGIMNESVATTTRMHFQLLQQMGQLKDMQHQQEIERIKAESGEDSKWMALFGPAIAGAFGGAVEIGGEWIRNRKRRQDAAEGDEPEADGEEAADEVGEDFSELSGADLCHKFVELMSEEAWTQIRATFTTVQVKAIERLGALTSESEIAGAMHTIYACMSKTDFERLGDLITEDQAEVYGLICAWVSKAESSRKTTDSTIETEATIVDEQVQPNEPEPTQSKKVKKKS